MKLVDLVGVHLEATSGAPLVILREHDEPHRMLPIFIGDNEAASIALALSGQVPPRPMTHDIMAALVESLDAHVDSVEVTELRDGAFIAELAVSGPSGDRRLDSRPSDAIALAVRVGAPLFVSEAVLDEAGAVLDEVLDDGTSGGALSDIDADVDEAVVVQAAFDPEIDPEAIEEAVAEFRGLLRDADARDFADPGFDDPST